MGLLKKLSKSLSGKKSSKERDRGQSQGNGVSSGGSHSIYATYGTQNGLTSSQIPQARPQDIARRSHVPPEPVQLEHIRQQAPQAAPRPSEAPSASRVTVNYGDRYINGSPFLSFKDSRQQRANSGVSEATLTPANIREVPPVARKKSKAGSDSEKPAKTFQRPKFGHGLRTQSSRGASIDQDVPSSSSQPPFVDTKPNPAVALTIIIDPSLDAAKETSANVMSDIAVGVLNLMRPLAPTDTISIFGCDESSSGLFTFPADKASYPQILDLVCKLHTQPLGRSPKLFDAVVMVVEELTCMSSESLKPLVIMSDYQHKEALGSSFEAQHALLWSSAQHLYPIFVSVWDSELYSDIRVKTSKEVHIETLGSQEVAAAFLVILSQLKAMIREHKLELENKKQRELQSVQSVVFESHASLPLSSAHSIRDSHLDSVDHQPEDNSLLQGLPSPDITDHRAQPSPQTPDDAVWQSSHRSPLSSWEQRGSEFDSVANFASSSDGNAERDAVSLTDYAIEPSKDRSTGREFDTIREGQDDSTASNLARGSEEFKGFKGPAQSKTEHNPLFTDHSESDYGSVKVEDEDVVLTEVPWGSIDLRDTNSYVNPHANIAFDSAPV